MGYQSHKTSLITLNVIEMCMFDHVTDSYGNRGINVKKSRSSFMGDYPKNDYKLGHNHELDVFLSNNVLFENIIDYDNIKKFFFLR